MRLRDIVAAAISIHALLAESDPSSTRRLTNLMISIHALLAESDYDTSSLMQCQAKFLSTLSLRRATNLNLPSRPIDKFLSTLSLRRATIDNVHSLQYDIISIHALLAESDFVVGDVMGKALAISIHALLAESDDGSLIYNNRCQDFYPRSPCGERRPANWFDLWGWAISIHALLAESDS